MALEIIRFNKKKHELNLPLVCLTHSYASGEEIFGTNMF